MSDLEPVDPDRLEQNTPATEGQVEPTPVDVVSQRGVPLDANEADVLEQSHVEGSAEDEDPLDV